MRIFALAWIAATVVIANIAAIAVPSFVAKRGDPRNSNVTVAVYPRWGVDPTVATFDIWGISDRASMADVTRVLLDTAEGMQWRSFRKVVLAYRGSERFQIDGAYFRKLGEERNWQNPVWTINNMPQNVERLDGRPAFGTWSGGWLGVASRQIEDHNDMHRQWWLRDHLRR